MASFKSCAESMEERIADCEQPLSKVKERVPGSTKTDQGVDK
jgi:hypothetical protein